MSNAINTLLTRRSVLANELCEPGPSDDDLQQILQAAHRVPDHKKLGPWRFIVFRENARVKFSEALGKIFANDNPDAAEKLLQFEAQRIARAPLVIAVVASPVENDKVPEWEQTLAVGAVCQNTLLAATALGFGAQWLTEWYSYHPEVDALLKLQEKEKVAGFIYVGSFMEKPSERVRPELEDRITYWR